MLPWRKVKVYGGDLWSRFKVKKHAGYSSVSNRLKVIKCTWRVGFLGVCVPYVTWRLSMCRRRQWEGEVNIWGSAISKLSLWFVLLKVYITPMAGGLKHPHQDSSGSGAHLHSYCSAHMFGTTGLNAHGSIQSWWVFYSLWGQKHYPTKTLVAKTQLGIMRKRDGF